MDLSRIAEGVHRRYPSRILTLDSHTAGEPTRLIVGGIERLPGTTMEAKRRYFAENLDRVRLLITREPRGHRGMLAALVTEPVSEGAQFGLIYMDPRRYPYLCGHGTIGAVTALIEAGALEAKGTETVIIVDTPSGPMKTRAGVKDGRVESVAIQTVPSFVYGRDEALEVPGIGTLTVDTVCVGGFFVMVSTDQIGLDLTPVNSDKLIRLGMRIIELANEQLVVHHPTRPEVTTVDVVEFYAPHDQHRGISSVIYGESHMDRSPCGTGTAAKMTLLHDRGELNIDEPYVNSGALGTTFSARLVEETRVGDTRAVVAEIQGSAHITGMNEFVLDPRDPFPEGFLI